MVFLLILCLKSAASLHADFCHLYYKVPVCGNQLKRIKDEYSFDDVPFDTSIKKENPVEHAIMVKASEYDDSGFSFFIDVSKGTSSKLYSSFILFN